MKDYKYLFGPVPSRRFGRSLGIDLIPYKTCSQDCVFCQLGRTTNKTITRKEYVPTDRVLDELKDWLKTDGEADYLTLSGSGEPTLHSRFGVVLDFIRTNSTIPAVLLTNGTMLDHQRVRDAASIANVVKVSLSAWDQASYGWVNRPSPRLRFKQLLEGQRAFRAQFKGKLWMEVFLIEGMNATPADVKKIAVLAKGIKPERTQLNTAIRPPAEDFAEPVPKEQLFRLIHHFRPKAEVISEFSEKKWGDLGVNQEIILSMLQRRPCTSNQISDVFGLHLNEVSKYIGNLLRGDQIQAERRKNNIYYRAQKQKGQK